MVRGPKDENVSKLPCVAGKSARNPPIEPLLVVKELSYSSIEPNMPKIGSGVVEPHLGAWIRPSAPVMESYEALNIELHEEFRLAPIIVAPG
jgi:hypothetical protein